MQYDDGELELVDLDRETWIPGGGEPPLPTPHTRTLAVGGGGPSEGGPPPHADGGLEVAAPIPTPALPSLITGPRLTPSPAAGELLFGPLPQVPGIEQGIQGPVVATQHAQQVHYLQGERHQAPTAAALLPRARSTSEAAVSDAHGQKLRPIAPKSSTLKRTRWGLLPY
jgi:hypothetical protein